RRTTSWNSTRPPRHVGQQVPAPYPATRSARLDAVAPGRAPDARGPRAAGSGRVEACAQLRVQVEVGRTEELVELLDRARPDDRAHRVLPPAEAPGHDPVRPGA